jgi:hypothetical protein
VGFTGTGGGGVPLGVAASLRRLLCSALRASSSFVRDVLEGFAVMAFDVGSISRGRSVNVSGDSMTALDF